ncbi:RDD family protein [Bacillus cereus group sp. BfR-BA-01380]|uniref:RDD family protein n=1 Tax=Bacillus cereus group sp. BfR-BA-01380 TaxID=2920324 RepID=UPI001F5831C3|nr:RDD family protein [Bacillus cereus group sp. BfR-BA-01380]
MDQQLAGFWRRFGANIIDGLLMVPFVVIFMLLGVSEEASDKIVSSLSTLYYLIVPIVWAGFTVGKKALNIRIVCIDGKEITIWTTLKRYLLAGFVYGITFGIAIIVSAFMVALRQDKRSIHDLIAGTQVIRD